MGDRKFYSKILTVKLDEIECKFTQKRIYYDEENNWAYVLNRSSLNDTSLCLDFEHLTYYGLKRDMVFTAFVLEDTHALKTATNTPHQIKLFNKCEKYSVIVVQNLMIAFDVIFEKRSILNEKKMPFWVDSDEFKKKTHPKCNYFISH